MDTPRIVSFLPSATEIACALGLADSLLGITHECDYPPEVRTKPVVVRNEHAIRNPLNRRASRCSTRDALAATVTVGVTGESQRCGERYFLERSDSIHANSHDDVAHRFEAGQRWSIDLERQQRSGRKATHEARAGAGQAAQRLVLGAPDRRRLGGGHTKIDEDPGRACTDRGADVRVDHRIIRTARAPHAGQRNQEHGDPRRPRRSDASARSHDSLPGGAESIHGFILLAPSRGRRVERRDGGPRTMPWAAYILAKMEMGGVVVVRCWLRRCSPTPSSGSPACLSTVVLAVVRVRLVGRSR